MQHYLIIIVIFVLLLILVNNKTNRLVYQKNGLRNSESHVALVIQQYLQGEGYTQAQATAVAISTLKTLNKLHVRNNNATT